MAAIQLSNNLGLAPPKAKPSIRPIEPQGIPSTLDVPPSLQSNQVTNQITGLPLGLPSESPPGLQTSPQTEFAFELPIGYVDATGRSHRRGVMRMARTVDEIEPMSDPRVQANPAYATVIILSQVILALGNLPEISPVVIEGMFAGDLNYLQNFYRRINLLED